MAKNRDAESIGSGRDNVVKPGAAAGKADTSVSFWRFFSPTDWLAAAVTFLLAVGLFAYTNAPTVTLEDSGELVVAADYLGVPHPPGYPLWTLLAWVFQWLFHWKGYLGHPNPAWGVGFMSGFFGAATSAVVALIVSRSGRDMIRAIWPEEGDADSIVHRFLRWTAATSAGLFLAFSHIMWTQSVIAEVYTLNTFMHMLIFLFAYVWMYEPDRNRYLYLASVVFGLTITNCQPVLLIVYALLIVIWFGRRELFRDALAVMSVTLFFWLISKYIETFDAFKDQASMPFRNTYELGMWTVVVILHWAGLIRQIMLSGRLFTQWKPLILMALFVGLGLTMFLYMPIASDQNPPMNWGYTRTMEGFKHAVTRGQYQKLDPAVMPEQFWKQAFMFFEDAEMRFTIVPLLLCLVPFFFAFRLDRRTLVWLASIATGYYFVSVIFTAILNPSHDVQQIFITRVQFLQADAIMGILLGYGLLLPLALLKRATPSAPVLAAVCCVPVLLLPGVSFYKSEFDPGITNAYGSASLRGHDFGWQFGCYQLEGAEGIKAELHPNEPPLPNPDFPPAMETNAIFFGGTDPGRFVPTYMIYSGGCRSDVFLITQNALADNTYLNVMRDLYGNDIYIPSAQDSNRAFQQYIEDVRAGRIPANAAIAIDPSGRVSVQGVQGVMEINGIICKMIFDVNKHKHAFYVEESYVINWMYPYLIPHGLIMKINSEPLSELTPEMVKNDLDFWSWYTKRLLNDPKFCVDMVARKSFSKLRCAIAGVYTFRRMFNEARTAFSESVALYPGSPEANFRLADLLLQNGRFDEALQVMEAYLKLDPQNDRIEGFITQIKGIKQVNGRINELQAKFQQQQGTLDSALELAQLYRQVGKEGMFLELTGQILGNTNVPPQAYLQVAEMMKQGGPSSQQYMRLAEIYQRYLQREPKDPGIWVELACIHVALNQPDRAMAAIKQAVAIGSEPVREKLRMEPRLQSLHNRSDFQQLVAPSARAPMFPAGLQF